MIKQKHDFCLIACSTGVKNNIMRQRQITTEGGYERR
jgi:hypothetical protein